MTRLMYWRNGTAAAAGQPTMPNVDVRSLASGDHRRRRRSSPRSGCRLPERAIPIALEDTRMRAFARGLLLAFCSALCVGRPEPAPPESVRADALQGDVASRAQATYWAWSMDTTS